MKLLHYHSQNYPSNRPGRVVYFAEVPKFSVAQLESVEKKKEREEPGKLDTQSLVEQANGVIAKHEQQLAVLPDEFNQLLHDEMVNYFLASPGRFEKDAEAGLNSAEFSAYREAMVSMVEKTMADYAPTEEEMGKIAESKEAAEKAAVAAEQIEPLNVDEVEEGLGSIETVEDLGLEFQRYNGWNMSLQQESSDLLGQIGELHATVAKFQEARSGIRAYRKFFSAAKDETFLRMCQLLARSEIQLKTVTEKQQAVEEKLKICGEVLAAESNRMKQELVAFYGVILGEVKKEKGEDGDNVKLLEENFEKISLLFNQLDADIDSAVLKNNMANQQLAGGVMGQKEFLSSVAKSIRDPMSFAEAAQIVWSAPLEVVGSAAGIAGKSIQKGVYSLSGFFDENIKRLQNIPVIGHVLYPPLYGLGKLNAEGAKLIAGGSLVVTGLVEGLSQALSHPLDSGEGILALVGRKPGTDSFWEGDAETAKQTWKNMGEDIFAVEDYKNGEYAFATGKVIANIITTVTGYAAVKAASKTGQMGKISYLSARSTGKTFREAFTEASIIGLRSGAQAAYNVYKFDILKNVHAIRNSAAKVQQAFQSSILALDNAIAKAPAAVRGKLQNLKESMNGQFSKLSDELGLEPTLVMEGPPSSGLDRTLADAPLSEKVSSQGPSGLDTTISDSRKVRREPIPEETEKIIQGLREVNPEAFSQHGDKVAKALAEGLTDGNIPSEVMDLLALDARKLFSAGTVEKLITGRVKPERMKILRANLDAPEFNMDYVDRILEGPPEKILVNGEVFHYYPNASVGSGGVGTFFKVGILDEATGKLSFAGAKQSIHSNRDLGTEVRGSKLVSEVLAKDPEAQKYLIEPIGIADDNTVIFYEVIERDGKARNLDDLTEHGGAPTEFAWNCLLDGARGLEKLHAQKILHGDFKASQIFIGENGGQLGDLGTVIPFDTYLYNGGMLPEQTATFSGIPVLPKIMPDGSFAWIGRLPNYDHKYDHIPLTPYYYSGDIYDVVARHGSQHAWKVDAYSLGVEIDSRVTGTLKMQRADIGTDGNITKSVGQFYEKLTTSWDFNKAKEAKLLKIAHKLKDPENLTYTVAHAVRDMEKILTSL